MKTFQKIMCVLGTVALCAACSQTPKPFVLQGKLENCHSPYALLIDGRIDLNDTIRIASDGTFSYQRVFNHPAYAFFYLPDDEAGTLVILINGTDNQLTGNATQAASLNIKGDLETAYPFLNGMGASLGAANELSSSCFAAFRSHLEHVADSLRKAVKQIPIADFQELVDQSIDESVKTGLVSYNGHLEAQGKAAGSDADYNAYMESIDLNDSLNNDLAYFYLHWVSDCKVGRDNTSYLDMLQKVQAKATDPMARQRLTKRLMAEYDRSTDPMLDSVFFLASEMLPDAKDQEVLRQKQVVLKGVKPGVPAIDCELTDPQDQTSHLSDLFGKVIYLDVWATWCGPCCAEIPYLEKLVAHFEGDNRIEFVSVTVDKDKDAWLKKLEADKPAWKQYRCTDFCTLYGIGGIPRFILIGKDGKLIDPNAPRPSDKNIIEYLKGYLK